MREKGNGNKKSHGAEHVELFIMVAITGSNWFRSEHILKERSEAQNVVSRGCRRLYDCRKKEKGKKKAPRSGSRDAFFLVGDNRIELLTFCL